ncbi:alkylmercury lyase family protein [Nonomuraea sp. NPDC003709]|uniref:alkylmercury lyase family protein n=1 Tax=Nonomuraea sp. NPDC003709 TaxID=3154450 RepID=UPI0033A6F1F9
MAMELTVVTVPDCPNAPILGERLARVLTELDANERVSITRHTVTDARQAARWRMRGSPTLLVDWIDPFADDTLPIGLACRMYRDEHGRLEGAPSVTELRRVLGQVLADGGPARGGPTPVWADALGRAGAGRVAPVEGGLRAVHQQVLRGFAETGAARQPGELERVAALYGVSAEQVLAELHAADFLRLDDAGQISAAYPFSAAPTAHRVRIADGPEVFAMCAIDALGMAAMLCRDVRISSVDPVRGQVVTVEVAAAGQAAWAPGTSVVFAGQQAACEPCASGVVAAAQACCGHVNFFTAPATAQAWAETHPQVHGRLLNQHTALELGVAIFGPLLAASPGPTP